MGWSREQLHTFCLKPVVSPEPIQPCLRELSVTIMEMDPHQQEKSQAWKPQKKKKKKGTVREFCS